MLIKVKKHDNKDRATAGKLLKFSDGAVMQVQKDRSLRRVGPPKLNKKNRVAKRRADKVAALQLASLDVNVQPCV